MLLIPCHRTGDAAKCLCGHARGKDGRELGHAHTVLRAKALKAFTRIEEQALVLKKEQHRRQGVLGVGSETQNLGEIVLRQPATTMMPSKVSTCM